MSCEVCCFCACPYLCLIVSPTPAYTRCASPSFIARFSCKHYSNLFCVSINEFETFKLYFRNNFFPKLNTYFLPVSTLLFQKMNYQNCCGTTPVCYLFTFRRIEYSLLNDDYLMSKENVLTLASGFRFCPSTLIVQLQFGSHTKYWCSNMKSLCVSRWVFWGYPTSGRVQAQPSEETNHQQQGDNMGRLKRSVQSYGLIHPAALWNWLTCRSQHCAGSQRFNSYSQNAATALHLQGLA